MWTKVCKASAVGEGQGLTVTVAGKEIAVFKKGGRLYAIDNVCPHQRGPLGDGHLDGYEVTCPWHAWVFDVRTGECQNALDFRQRIFKVKEEKGDLFIEGGAAPLD